MARSHRWLAAVTGALVGAACGMTGTIAWAEQGGPQQRPAERHDPATSGAGPTSGAPGQLDREPRKGAPPTTTDARGVTTTQPKSARDGADGAESRAPRDYGNESAGTTPK